jgi:hypothetical protein
MNKVPYIKSSLSYDDQISLLKTRGLRIADEVKAMNVLKNISLPINTSINPQLTKSEKNLTEATKNLLLHSNPNIPTRFHHLLYYWKSPLSEYYRVYMTILIRENSEKK